MKKNPMVGLGCLLALTLSGCAAGAPATVVDETTGPAAQVSSWLARHAGPSWSDCPAEALPEPLHRGHDRRIPVLLELARTGGTHHDAASTVGQDASTLPMFQRPG